MQRRLAAVLIADVAGYTKLVERDTEGTVAAWKAARAEVIDPQVAAHQGRLVKLTGDGFLAEFTSVRNAVACALAMQRALIDNPLDFRMGVNLGDIVDDGEDIHGEGVNIAARIEALAPTGGLSISGAAHEQVRNRLDETFTDASEHLVKHVSVPVRVWQWAPDGVVVTAEPAPLARPERPSIAVLPFNNRSGDAEQAFFADGITEDIITEISRIPALFVIARNSSFTFRGQGLPAGEVCRALGVRYVLEGSVRKAGARVRVTAQLTDGDSGGSVWAERYDRELADIFDVQDDVTAQIVAALHANLVPGNRAAAERPATVSPEAYDCVLRGREQYRLYTPDGNAAARDLFERAVALDPDYAEAYAGLAETHWQDWFVGAKDGLDRAFELARKAKRLDPDLPLVYEALSSVHLFRREFDEAVATAERWLEIEPGNAEAHANMAAMLQFAGEPGRVIGLVETAKRLNPSYPFYYNLYAGMSLLTRHRFEEAMTYLSRSRTQNPDSMPTHVYLVTCHSHLGQAAEARAALDEVLRLRSGLTVAGLRDILFFRRSQDVELVVEGMVAAELPA